MTIWRYLRGRRRTSPFGGMDGSQVDRLVEKEQKREWCEKYSQKYERRSKMMHKWEENPSLGKFVVRCPKCNLVLGLHGLDHESATFARNILVSDCPGPPKETAYEECCRITNEYLEKQVPKIVKEWLDTPKKWQAVPKDKPEPEYSLEECMGMPKGARLTGMHWDNGHLVWEYKIKEPKEKPGLPDEGPLWESRGDTITLSCAHSIYRFLVDIRDYLAAREKS